MGCCSGDKVEPGNGELKIIKDLTYRQGSSADFKSANRNTTDIIFLILHTIFVIGLGGLMIYCICYGDINRIINGYDNCGNICGEKNIKATKKSDCEGVSMEDKPLLLVYNAEGMKTDSRMTVTSTNEDQNKQSKTAPWLFSDNVGRICVQNCSEYPNFRQFLNRCVTVEGEKVAKSLISKTGLNDFFQEASEDLQLCWREIVYLCIISLVFSIIIMILLRYLVGIVVWLVLVGVVLACIAGTTYLWLLWKTSKDQNETQTSSVETIGSRRTTSYLAFAIIATIVTFIVLLIVLVLRKRIQLVIQIFREAGKAIGAMPLLLLEPLLTFVCLGFVVSVWLYFTLWIESSGHAKEIRKDFYLYEKDFPMQLARWYNLLAMLWMTQFIIGCQHMIIAGAVAAWYFTRKKDQLGTPIFYSFHNLTRYHLGSVSLGSLIIALVQFLRIVLGILQKYLKKYQGNSCVNCTLKCCQCCLYCFEKVLKYLTRNAYIEVAIYGYSFCRAGKQAFKLLTANALRVAAINSVGDFVLFLGKVLVVMATVLIGMEFVQKKEGLQHMWVPLALVGLFAYFVAHCFLTVYEMAIDTIFLCFCEDCEHNDGVSRPYFMSRDLMEFVENSKKPAVGGRNESKDQGQKQTPTISASLS